MDGKRFWGAAALACALGLAGCGGLLPAPAPDRVVLHDFGPAPRFQGRGASFVTVWVTSVPWLRGTDIHYRLLYRDPTAVHSYADNRWLVPPAELLKERLRASLGAVAPPAAGQSARLVVTLVRFAQDFRSPHEAVARLELEVRLVRLAGGEAAVRDSIQVQVPCSADAQGAVTGLSRAAILGVRRVTAFVAAQAKNRD